MKAVGLYRYLPIDDPESFLDLEIDTPVASGRDLLVEVKAISVNPVDTKRRAPKDLVEKAPKVLGWDVAAESRVVHYVTWLSSNECGFREVAKFVYYKSSKERLIRHGSGLYAIARVGEQNRGSQ